MVLLESAAHSKQFKKQLYKVFQSFTSISVLYSFGLPEFICCTLTVVASFEAQNCRSSISVVFDENLALGNAH